MLINIVIITKEDTHLNSVEKKNFNLCDRNQHCSQIPLQPFAKMTDEKDFILYTVV